MPRPRSPLVGRHVELRLASSLLLDQMVPLVTLTGPGGVGKTRLALQIAAECDPGFGDGICFVDLSAVRDPGLVLTSIAVTIHVPGNAHQSVLDSIVEHLSDKHMLLVLDNLEQVIESAPQIGERLERCPRLAMLATSRVALRLSVEQMLPVEPLTEDDANDLFAARARATNPHFLQTQSTRGIVSEICRRMDYLPLAIELAAARVAVLSLTALLARLDRSLPLLTEGPRDRPERLRTMRGAIAWSYDLLPPELQSLFRRLAIFDGGFQLDAATSVAGFSEEAEIFDGIALLSAHSLLTQSGNPYAPEPRYGMLETVREFGLEQLDAHGERPETERRHASWYASWFQAAVPELRGPHQAHLTSRSREEFGNASAAIRWSLAHDHNLARWLLMRPHGRCRNLREMESMNDSIRQLLATWSGSRSDRAGMLVETARSFYMTGRYAEGAAYASEAATEFQNLGDTRGMASALVARGHNLIGVARISSSPPSRAGNLTAADDAFRQGIAFGRELADRRIIARATRGCANVALHRGDYEVAAQLLADACDYLADLGPHDVVANTSRDLGVALFLNDEMTSAAAMLGRALEMQRGLDDQGWGYGQTLKTVSLVLLRWGYTDDAIRLYQSASIALSEQPSDVGPTFPLDELPMQAAIKDNTFHNDPRSSQDFDTALTMAEAVERALALLAEVAEGTSSSTAPPPLAPDALGLTPREREVLRLLAQGLTDRAIAELSVSPHTIHGHVSNVLGKLGVDSRAAAAAFAVRHGLS